ncbi:hypothetical protein C8J55DRAFT_297163 [Lentinula edodes]|uniref:DUF7053 domain-containing protein n=1 Tax=Lentinula lateritia TaxID=40482 RepID=A0A9W9ARS2_9AGAR|nr:hypothetical protein C8J55DRAFT_297163 [Lentinula edodes]
MVSGWPFFLSFTKTHAKTISGSDISVDDVLRILHDPPALAGLNALVTKCQVLDPSKPNLYTLHDDLRIFGLFKKDIVYTVNFLPTSDGTDTEVKAGLWTTLKEQWRVVKKGEIGEVTVSEKVTVRVSGNTRYFSLSLSNSLDLFSASSSFYPSSCSPSLARILVYWKN